MASITERGQFPYPGVEDVDDPPADFQRLTARMAEVLTFFSDVPLNERAAASAANRGTFHRDPATGIFTWSTGTQWVVVQLPRTVRIPHTFTASPDVLLPNGDLGYIPPFFVPVPSTQTVRLHSVRYAIRSGTSASVQVQRNGAAIDGLQNVTVTTTSTTATPVIAAAGGVPANVVQFNDNDRLQIVVTGVAGTPKNLTFTCFLDYTF